MLLATKLYIPTLGPLLIPRARLVKQIAAALQAEQRLVLLAAPAGCGKTTVVLEWIHSVGAPPVAWLALDDYDNSPGRFLTYLIASIETLRPGAGHQASVLLRAAEDDPPARVILTTLLNALTASSDPLVLVLEDYHVITHGLIHAAVALLLERMPAHMHLIITSRADPPLPLARLRVKRQLVELRATDLRFTTDEVAAFFIHSYDLNITGEAIARFATHTEGWAAGLQLAALTLQEQDATQYEARLTAFTGSHRYVLDYLADEVFNRLPAPLQIFLIRTSFLRRMCGPLCTAITGQADAQAVLEYLERENLFLVRLDNHRIWYRYHHLFADFLQRRLHTLGESDAVQVYEQASVWFERQGYLGEAIEYALAAHAWDRVLQLLSTLAAGQNFPDYSLDWRRWVVALPTDLLHQKPELALGLAQHLLLLGEAETGERLLRIAEEVWQTTQATTKLGQVLTLRAGMALLHANHPRACQLARQALTQIATADTGMRQLAAAVLGMSSAFLGDIAAAEHALALALHDIPANSTSIAALSALATRGLTATLRGRLREATTHYQAAIERAAEVPANQQPAVFIYLSFVHYEWNDLTQAALSLQTGIAVGEQSGRLRYWPIAYWAQARLAIAQGAWEQAQEYLAQACTMASLLGSPTMLSEAEIWRAQFGLMRGNLELALAWLATTGLDMDDTVSYERQQAHLLLARIHVTLARQSGAADLPGVTRLLTRLLQAAGAAGRLRDVVRILVVQAQVYALVGDPDMTAQVVLRALALAEPEGYIRSFIDEGPDLLNLLSWPMVRQGAPDYTRRLLQAAGLDLNPTSALATPLVATTILSERELMILHLLAQGLSLPAIATQLVISVHTARTHVKNIYGKLEVNNRVRALARAQELHIL